ncbi:heme-binding protein 2 [Betta splendens]|uniref:Heme-binding protein 1 n=1 Tax=Betta splendens TaxID=158456 RepID=A0A6P7NCT1_BETSP|nr:heme-binding protein 2 [Betta splendens]
MIYLSGLVGFLLLLTAEARVGNSSELSFCFETEQCLLYDLICKTDNYEVRHYDSVNWVSTQETSFIMEFALYKSFGRLYDYITGANQKGVQIAMTAPVVVKVSERAVWERKVYTMSFLLPAEYQKNPPGPTDDKVFIQSTPDLKVYVQSYGGWLTYLTDRKAASSLSTALDSVDAEYNRGFHYAVGYNSPIRIFNRHNEVWMVAEDDPECPSSEEQFP